MSKYHQYGELLILGLIVLLASCMPSLEPEESAADKNKTSKEIVGFSNVERMQIQRAVNMVEMTLGDVQDGGGYQSWTPAKAVEELVPLLNATLAPMPGEQPLPGIAGKIRYVRGRVTGPWQILLIPVNARKVIRIEGYGRNIKKPVYTKEIRVSTFG